MIKKSKQRDRDYIRLILAENDMWVKPTSPGGSSLMRAVSSCLFFTEVYHEQIQQRVIQFFLENLNRQFFNFFVKKDRAWIRLFVSHPGLPEFEHANMELIACTFYRRVKLYYICNGVLCSDMYSAKGLPTLRVFKVVDGHYAALFPSDFGHLAVVAQNVVLSSVEAVLNKARYEYRSLNHDKFIGFEFNSWKQRSGPSPLNFNHEDFLSAPLEDSNFNIFSRFSIGKPAEDIEFSTDGQPLGEQIVSSLKSRKLLSTPQSEQRVPSLGGKEQSPGVLEECESENRHIEFLENAYVEDLYSFILNQQFEAHQSRAPIVKAFLQFVHGGKEEYFDCDRYKEKEEYCQSDEESVSPFKGTKNAKEKSQTRSLPNRQDFPFRSEHENRSDSRDDKRHFRDFDDQFSMSKSRNSNSLSSKEDRSQNGIYFESNGNGTTAKTQNEEALQKSNLISMEQSKDSWPSRPQALLHSHSLPNMDPRTAEEIPAQAVSEPLLDHTKIEMDSEEPKPVEDLTVDSNLLTFRKDNATHSVGPKKLSLREKMLEKMKTKRLEEFNATVTSHTHSSLEVGVSPTNPFSRMGPPLVNPQILSTPFNTEEAVNEDPLDGGLKPAYFAKLDPQYYTGVLKFFDEKNGFGFVTMLAENSTEDIFVYRNEFDKAKISMETLRALKTGDPIRLSFQITRYTGKYKESKKASSLRLLNDLA